MKHRKARLGFRLAVADHIRIRGSTGGDGLLFTECFNSIDPIPKAGSQLEIQSFRSLQHLLTNGGSNGSIIAQKQLTCLSNDLAIFLPGMPFLTPAGALIHVIIQARPSLSDVTWESFGAIGQLQGTNDGFHQGLCHPPAAKGSEILRVIVFRPADHGHRRILILHIQANIGVTLVILQKNIVLRLIPFDQRTFQDQCFKLRSRYDHIKGVDVADHQAGLTGMGGRILKILADPVFQLLRLAHIDHSTGFIFHDIRSRFHRERQCFCFQFLKNHKITGKIASMRSNDYIEARNLYQ